MMTPNIVNQLSPTVPFPCVLVAAVAADPHGELHPHVPAVVAHPADEVVVPGGPRSFPSPGRASTRRGITHLQSSVKNDSVQGKSCTVYTCVTM